MCKYCNFNNSLTKGESISEGDSCAIEIEKFEHSGFLCISNNDKYVCESMIINYCPMCGRKLK